MKPYIIGIAGGSAGGKSTFANMLAKELETFNVKVFSMDSYFKPKQERPFIKAPFVDKEYMDDNHPETVNLKKLNADLQFAVNDNYNIIIIEGLLTLWDEDIYKLLNLKLFVDCRADERIVRRLRRNMSWGRTFDEVADVYLDMVRYRHDEYVEPTKWRADLILNGSSRLEQAATIICEYVKNTCNRE